MTGPIRIYSFNSQQSSQYNVLKKLRMFDSELDEDTWIRCVFPP